MYRVAGTLLLLLSACGPTPPGTGSSSGTSTTSSTSTTSGVSTTSTDTSSGATTDVTTTGVLDIAVDPPTSGTTGQCAAWPWRGCGDTSLSQISGTASTPIGSFTPLFAVFGAETYCGTCVEPNIHRILLVDDPAQLEGVQGWSEPDEGMEVFPLAPGDGFMGPEGQPVMGLLVMHRGGMMESTPAQVTIENLPSVEDLDDPFDPMAPGVVSGSVEAQGDGWSVSIGFESVYCPDTNDFYICE